MNPAREPLKSRRLSTRFGPWAVVTGASSGIGMQFARELAAGGINVLLIARRKDLLAALAIELSERHGVRAEFLEVDLDRPTSTAEILAAVAAKEIGLLVCSAGFGSSGAFIESDLTAESSMVNVNCRSLMELTWYFARRFVAQRRGGIVLMSSLVGFQGVPKAANYAATKAYVQSLAEALHHELKPHGVAVIASAPGPIHSGFAARARMTLGRSQQPSDVAAATLAALGNQSTVRPGWLSKTLGWSLMTLPRWARVRLMSIIMGGMATRTD